MTRATTAPTLLINPEEEEEEEFYISALFFADDGLLLANSLKQAEQLFWVMKRAAGQCRLEINTLKSNCTIFNSVDVVTGKFLGMDVVEQIKYLGVTVSNKKNCFHQHKNEKILQVTQMTNLTYSVIARSCNKVLIGKRYWKSVTKHPVCLISNYLDQEGAPGSSEN